MVGAKATSGVLLATSPYLTGLQPIGPGVALSPFWNQYISCQQSARAERRKVFQRTQGVCTEQWYFIMNIYYII